MLGDILNRTMNREDREKRYPGKSFKYQYGRIGKVVRSYAGQIVITF